MTSVEVLEANPHKLADEELKASLRSPLITEVIFWSSRGNLDMVKEIVAKCNLDVSEEDFADYDKRTPLHLAAAEGCYRVCQWLLSQNVNINSVDRFNQTPLGSALLAGHTQVMYSRREGDPKVWSTVLITALGSWEKPVPRGHCNPTAHEAHGLYSVPTIF
jgi:hypothetical protein